jgi:sulfoxide reductase heme-binding subunit YedZ
MKNARIELSVAVAWLLALAVVVVSDAGDHDAYSRALALTRGFGLVALMTLCAALCISPLARVLRQAWPAARVRRALGIAAFAGAVVHWTTALFAVPDVWSRLWDSPMLRAGFGALVILGLLAATSYKSVVRDLHLTAWKELHRLAYVALPFAFFHAAQGTFAPLRTLFVLGCVTLLVGLLRLLPKKQRNQQEGAKAGSSD